MNRSGFAKSARGKRTFGLDMKPLKTKNNDFAAFVEIYKDCALLLQTKHKVFAKFDNLLILFAKMLTSVKIQCFLVWSGAEVRKSRRA